MQPFAVCFVTSLNLIVGFYYCWSDEIEPMFHEQQQQQDTHILAILGDTGTLFQDEI